MVHLDSCFICEVLFFIYHIHQERDTSQFLAMIQQVVQVVAHSKHKSECSNMNYSKWGLISGESEDTSMKKFEHALLIESISCALSTFCHSSLRFPLSFPMDDPVLLDVWREVKLTKFAMSCETFSGISTRLSNRNHAILVGCSSCSFFPRR